MENIQSNALKTFSKNLKYFQRVDTKLFNKIVSLSMSIDNEKYQQRYHLEYIQENKCFDIYDDIDKFYIYNKQTTIFNSNALRQMELDDTNTIKILDENLYNNTKEASNNNNIHDELLSTKANLSNDILEYTKQFNLQQEEKYKKIEKMVFIGTILGIHIPSIIKKMHSNTILICEPNLEIFRLSLFTTNYFEIGKNNTILYSIAEDRSDFHFKFKIWLQEKFYTNYIVKYHTTNYNIEDYFDRIASNLSRYSPLIYSYSNMLDILLKRSFENIEIYPTLKTANLHTILKDKPVLLLAAGPSLAKNIEWIKKNQKKYFVVAIAATIIELYNHDIMPDLITSADPGLDVFKQFPEYIINYIDNIPFLAMQQTNKNLLKKLNSKNIFLFEVMTTIKSDSIHIAGFSIGELTLHLLCTLGANNIYMLGTDLALDQETGATHSSNYMFNSSIDLDKEKNTYNSFVEKGEFSTFNSTMIVKGNFRDKVITTSVLNNSLNAYNDIIKICKEKDHSLIIYNFSDGAYLNHTIPCDINTVNISKDINTIMLNKYLHLNSSSSLDKNEQSFIDESIYEIHLLLSEIEKIKILKAKIYSHFYEQRKVIFNIIMQILPKYNNTFIAKILQNYILITEPYIYKHCNMYIDNESNLIKKIKTIWIRQIKLICNKYIHIVSEKAFDKE